MQRQLSTFSSLFVWCTAHGTRLYMSSQNIWWCKKLTDWFTQALASAGMLCCSFSFPAQVTIPLQVCANRVLDITTCLEHCRLPPVDWSSDGMKHASNGYWGRSVCWKCIIPPTCREVEPANYSHEGSLSWGWTDMKPQNITWSCAPFVHEGRSRTHLWLFRRQ